MCIRDRTQTDRQTDRQRQRQRTTDSVESQEQTTLMISKVAYRKWSRYNLDSLAGQRIGLHGNKTEPLTMQSPDTAGGLVENEKRGDKSSPD